VLGGFIRDSKTEGKSGVPYLKDIPVLGYLFRSTSTRNERRELLVLIRPTVLATPEAAALKAQEIRSEMPTVNEVEREIREREQKMLKKYPPTKSSSLKQP
jgi:general secretion pathway protein D